MSSVQQHDLGRQPSRDSLTKLVFTCLRIKGIPVVEYGGQLLHKLGGQDAEEVRLYEAANNSEYHMQYIEWAIPDEQMQLAVTALRGFGFTSDLRTGTNAYKLINGTNVPNLGWDASVNILGYKFPRSQYAQFGLRWVHLYLIPLSATGLTISDTLEIRSTFSPHYALRMPIPPRYIYSLMRLLNDRTRDDPGRHRFESDLIKAINGVIIDKGYAPFPKNTPEHDICVQEAIGDLDRWVEKGVWPQGKEEDLEVLKALVNDLDLVRWMYREDSSNDSSSGGLVLGEVA